MWESVVTFLEGMTVNILFKNRIIDTFVWNEEVIWDTFIYDGKDSEMSLYGIWVHKSFEKSEF